MTKESLVSYICDALMGGPYGDMIIEDYGLEIEHEHPSDELKFVSSTEGKSSFTLKITED